MVGPASAVLLQLNLQDLPPLISAKCESRSWAATLGSDSILLLPVGEQLRTAQNCPRVLN